MDGCLGGGVMGRGLDAHIDMQEDTRKEEKTVFEHWT